LGIDETDGDGLKGQNARDDPGELPVQTVLAAPSICCSGGAAVQGALFECYGEGWSGAAQQFFD
jgi:hypothetical protein